MKALKKLFAVLFIVASLMGTAYAANEDVNAHLSGNPKDKAAQADAIRVVADLARKNPAVLKALRSYVEARQRAQQMQKEKKA